MAEERLTGLALFHIYKTILIEVEEIDYHQNTHDNFNVHSKAQEVTGKDHRNNCKALVNEAGEIITDAEKNEETWKTNPENQNWQNIDYHQNTHDNFNVHSKIQEVTGKDHINNCNALVNEAGEIITDGSLNGNRYNALHNFSQLRNHLDVTFPGASIRRNVFVGTSITGSFTFGCLVVGGCKAPVAVRKKCEVHTQRIYLIKVSQNPNQSRWACDHLNGKFRRPFTPEDTDLQIFILAGVTYNLYLRSE
ncbi:hypothetical protein HUJ04_004171 [Dendroctonus ponderosae]|nr:hypothetical protein HUJ04_004171 [Dendroctonus ponderosae]